MLIDAARTIAGSDVLAVYGDLAALPPFNPDLDADETLPVIVAAWRDRATDAAALLVSVPEYAHGLPGAFKNALDWLVGSTALMKKPVAIWTATTRAVHAPAQLREVLTTMAAAIDEKASIAIDVSAVGADAGVLLCSDETRTILSAALERLLLSARNRSSPSPH